MARGDVSEREWETLAPLLPPEHSDHRGRPYQDHRRVLNGILWVLRTGAPWRDLPERYGPWQTCYDRFRRWQRDGTWQSIFERAIAMGDAVGQVEWEGCALDGSYIKAHPDAAGARRAPARADTVSKDADTVSEDKVSHSPSAGVKARKRGSYTDRQHARS